MSVVTTTRSPNRSILSSVLYQLSRRGPLYESEMSDLEYNPLTASKTGISIFENTPLRLASLRSSTTTYIGNPSRRVSRSSVLPFPLA